MTLRILSLAALCAVFATGSGLAAKDEDAGPTPVQILENAPADAWRPIDLENTLVMDLPAGDVVIEMRPDFAPKHVERIKKLTRDGFYNGLTFHRVIEGFVAQAGDPKGDGTGGSDLPDLQQEFLRDTKDVDNFVEIGRDRIASRIGFIDGMRVGAQPESLRVFKTDREVDIWGLHCAGVMSMARTADPDTANSQFFLMIGESRLSLDKRYTIWGWIVDGQENSRRIERGEPPTRPTPIIRMRVAADMPKAEQPNVQVLRTSSDTFKKYLAATGLVNDGYIREICNIKAPRRVDGKIEL